MGLFATFLGILGFGIGIPLGLCIGFYFFIYSDPKHVQDPIIKPLDELDNAAVQDILPEIPVWVKHPDYERVDWLNKFVFYMWPYLDKAVCSMIRSIVQPIFVDYIGKFPIESIEFENLSLGTLPPNVQGLKIYESNEKELVMEPSVKWAGNPNITVVLKLSSFRVTVQLLDLQVFVAPRITLKPLVPAFPCFVNILVSLMEKPHIDFGLEVLGGDIMAIPGLYRFAQETIKKQVASLYLWPRYLEVPILDASTMEIKRPVGILHVNVVRALRLLKMDLLGSSDPYVKLYLSGDRLPAKRTTVKKKNLNPEWNENFKLTVKDPNTQLLHISVYDWDKVGGDDKLGVQLVPLKLLTPHVTKELMLDLLKSTSSSKSQDKKHRGRIVVELTYVPFKDENNQLSERMDEYGRKESGTDRSFSSQSPVAGAGLLLVTVHGAEDVEGERHNNPFAVVLFRGDEKKSKMIRKCRNPKWNEDFQFMVEEPPTGEKIHIQVMSKRTGFGFKSKESLGHIDINLDDVLHNGRINRKYHLIDSKNGVIHVELGWKTI